MPMWPIISNEKGAILALYVLVDLLASVPFVVMLEQRRFYLLTAICYFAIAIASSSAKALQSMVLSEKAAARTSWGLTLLTVLVMLYAVGNMHPVK